MNYIKFWACTLFFFITRNCSTVNSSKCVQLISLSCCNDYIRKYYDKIDDGYD